MKTLIAMMFASTVAVGSVSALEVNGEIGGTTDYVWRGLSQNDGNPAAQAGVGITFENGIFGNAWASQVDNGVKGDENGEGAEIDLTVGWAGETGRYGYGVQVTRYIFTEQNFMTDFTEFGVFGDMGLFGGTASAAFNYTHDLDENSNNTVKMYNSQLGYAYEIQQLWGIDAYANAGYTSFQSNPDAAAPADYANWNVGLGKNFGVGYGHIRTYVEYTNVNSSARQYYGDIADETVLAGVKYEF